MTEVESWIKPGGKYRTRGGREAEVFATDMGGGFTCLGRVRGATGEWRWATWVSDGRAIAGNDNPSDLMRPDEVSDEAGRAYLDAAMAADGPPVERVKAGLAAAFVVMLAEREGRR